MNLQRRLVVARTWMTRAKNAQAAAQARGSQIVLPAEAEVAQLARTWQRGLPDPSRFGPWSAFLADLLWLTDAGAPDPISAAFARNKERQAGRQIRPLGWEATSPARDVTAVTASTSPTPPPRSIADSSTDETEIRYRALVEWRDKKGLTDLRDLTLRHCAMAPLTPASVEKRLPENLRKHSASIVAVMQNAIRSPRPAGPVTAAPRVGSTLVGTGPTPPGVGTPTPPGVTAPIPPGLKPPGVQTPPPQPPAPSGPVMPPRPEGAIAFLDDPEELAEASSLFLGRAMNEPIGEPKRLRLRRRAGIITLTWDEAENVAHPLYRVVMASGDMPYTPASAKPIVITRGRSVSLPYSPEHAITHFQVWVHDGATSEEAEETYAKLHARVVDVAPLQGFTIRDEGGQAVLAWNHPSGASQYYIYRGNAQQVAMGLTSQAPIAQAPAGSTGWVDAHVPPGSRLTYAVEVEARGQDLIDGQVQPFTQRSNPVELSFEPKGRLERVDDLTVSIENRGEIQVFDLVWTAPPSGEVLVFCSNTAPQQGVREGTHPASSLTQMGFSEEKRLLRPWTRDEQGVVTMKEVPWPEDWETVWFTPVTKLGDEVAVGAPMPFVRPGRVSDLKIHERSLYQSLTFRWHGKTAAVKVYELDAHETDIPAAIARTPHLLNVEAAEYKKLGGVPLPRPLTPTGSIVAVVPITFDAQGAAEEGQPVTAVYRGLLHAGYSVKWVKPRRGDNTLFITCWANPPIPMANPQFALVYNSERIPLDIADGQIVNVVPSYPPEHVQQPGEPLPGVAMQTWHYPTLGMQPQPDRIKAIFSTSAQGYIRVFVVGLTPEQRAELSWTDANVYGLKLS